ncbi:MAG: Plug domain-containing protein [Bryobacteraceae bacterium]
MTASGFKQFSQKGIIIRQNEAIRLPVNLEVGDATQTVEVTSAASALNVETPEVKGTISRTEIEALPLQVAGGQRSAATFVTLLPGVTPGGGQSGAFEARFSGGQRFSDEAILDGVTMQEGLLSQSGMVAIHNDFPIAPEAVDEISVLTSNYDVQYGSSSAAVIIASTKQGTNQFHGGAYEYHRNTVFNARPWGAATRPRVQQNDYGLYLGGPIRWRALWNNKVKTYFFGHHERFRSVGATTKPILTVPTERMRSGDFGEWPNPIYDPNTTRPNPTYDPSAATGPNNLPFLRQQFMGCNGTQLNVICGTDPRIQSSLAQNWLKLVPLPNRPGWSRTMRLRWDWPAL